MPTNDVYELLMIEPLTEQETTVLHLLVEGLSNREIAERLFLSASTVKWYVRQLNSKLNTSNRDEIVAQARALGLVQPEAEPAGAPHNLPVQTTPFIGRTEQILDVRHLLDDERVRLLTILAPGGMGKTRLALQSARLQMPHFADGVYFIDLTPLGSLENQLQASVRHMVMVLCDGCSLLDSMQQAATRAPDSISRDFQQFFTELETGLPLDEALERFQRRTTPTPFSQVMGIVRARMDDETSVAAALEAWMQSLYANGDDAAPNTLDYVQNLIISAIAQAVGFQFQTGGRTQKQQLLDYLAHKQMLLLLDNFEHLLDGATLVDGLLQHAPQLKVLVTSRERLNLVGETVYTLAGMGLPDGVDSDDVIESDSAQLFVQVARRTQADFAVTEANLDAVVRICHLTEGMPLGLLLAASWLDVLTPPEIAAEIQKNIDFLETEMRDIPDRQRNIRAVFESAWDRLSQIEREVFMRLSVFRGGFTRDAAETIAGATLRSLKSLATKSLVSQATDGLYRLHRLLGQFAAEKLAQTPHADHIQAQHRAYYAGFARKWGRALCEGQQLEGLQHLENALENIYAAFYSAAQHSDVRAINDLIEMWYFFDIRCLWQEGTDLFEIAASSIDDPVVRAKIAGHETLFTFRLGLADKTLRLAQESYDVLKDADVGVDLAIPLNTLGVMAYFRGDLDAAAHYLQEAAALAEHYNDPCRLAIEMGNLSIIIENRGDLEMAYAYLERQLALAIPIGDYMNMAMAYLNLADVSIQMGKYEEADAFCEKCIEFAGRIGQRQLATAAISQIGHIAYLQAKYDEAHKLLLRSLERNRQQGNIQHLVRNLGHLGHIAAIQGNLPQAGRYYQEALLLVGRTGFRPDGLMMLPNIARYFARRGSFRRAVEIASLVEAHEATRHDKRVEARALLDEYRTSLPEEAFEAAQYTYRPPDLDALIAALLPDLG